MRILHVIEGLGRGGAERRLVNDLTYLRTNGFAHRVCTLTDDLALAPEVERLGIPVHRLGLSRLSDWRTGIARLSALLEAHPADLVHSQLFWADCYARVVAKRRGLPMLVTLQSSAFQPGEFLYSWKRHGVEYALSRWSGCRYVAVSAYVRRSAIEHLHVPQERVTLIPNSVDVSRFQPPPAEHVATARAALRLRSDDRVLIMVGRLDPPKGHQVLFEALAQLRSSSSSVKMLIVGDGPLEARLRKLVRTLGLETLVQFLGARDDIPLLMAASDVYVFPTKCEGLPLTVLEAMAMAKPCVASRIGPIEEIIDQDGRTGYLVDRHTPQAWASTLARVLEDPSRESVGRQGAAVVRERFAANRQAARLGQFYTCFQDDSST